MKSFATLVKLMKTRVDDQRRFLAKLQADLEKVETDIVNLTTRCAIEQEAVARYPEYGMTYGAFLQMAIAASRELERRRVAAASAVEVARDQLARLFEEQKRYEIAEEARLAELAKEEAHRETIMMDEIGSVSFLRKHKK